MRNKVYEDLRIEGAKLMPGSYKNFAGRASKYNRAGARNFNVIIDDPEVANALREAGWNVKIRMPRDEGDSPTYFLGINVSFGNDYFRDPQIVRMTSKTRTELTEEDVAILDDDDILSADLVIRPHNSTDDNGENRVKGYLKEAWITVADSFSDKYSDR